MPMTSVDLQELRGHNSHGNSFKRACTLAPICPSNTTMTYNRVSLSDAVRLLMSCTRTASGPPSEEALAASTHWIDGCNSVPYVTEEMTSAWNALLGRYLVLQADPLQRLDTGGRVDRDMRKRITRSHPFPHHARTSFTFVDLFAGIGGFRLSLQALGGRCVFASELDAEAKRTYWTNFGVVPFGDIRQFTGPSVSDEELSRTIPDHDVLAAGFPCQPFSIAGIAARNHYGIKTGMDCETQGNLFADLARIISLKRPALVLLENVRQLLSNGKGTTFRIVRETLETTLGYEFHYDVLDSSSLVPQRRKRCYIVCFRDKSNKFTFPELLGPPHPLREALDPVDGETDLTISDTLWLSHIARSQRNRLRGTGFTVKLANLDLPAPTLVARYGKDGKECLIPQDGCNPRMLSPRECARLQGFPDQFVLPGHKSSAYTQFGNAVPVPVVQAIAARALRKMAPRHRQV